MAALLSCSSGRWTPTARTLRRGRCYTDLASFLASITELAAARGSPVLWHRLAQHHQYRVRRAVEHGWESVAAIRAEHQAETRRDTSSWCCWSTPTC